MISEKAKNRSVSIIKYAKESGELIANEVYNVHQYILDTNEEVIKIQNSNKLMKRFIDLGIRDDYLNRLLNAKKCGGSVTKIKMITLYGEVVGLQLWDAYRKRQAETNTFEYKEKVYGMTKDDFDEYNKSRSVTLENCKLRHGEEAGTEIFNNYREVQRTAGISLDYFISKHGAQAGADKFAEVCKAKAKAIKTKYNSGNAIFKQSKIGNDFCISLLPFVSGKYYCYTTEGGKEFGSYDEISGKYYFYDFVCDSVVFEFNGDYWHANPNKYSSEDKICGTLVSQIWESDKLKLDHIKNRGYNVMVVWENEYKNDKEGVLLKCREFYLKHRKIS